MAAIFAGLCIHVFGKGFFKMFGRGGVTECKDAIEITDYFTELNINLDAADIKIEYGEKARVEYRLAESAVPDVFVESGTLHIKKKDNKGWGMIPFGIGDSYILVVIPEGLVLDDLTINHDAGDLDIISIETDDLNIDVDAGDIEIKGVTAEEAEFDVDAGNIELAGCKFDELTVDVDAGNVNLTGCTVEKISADIDAGNIESHDSNINSGRVEADLGNIALHGEIGDVNTKVSLGNVEVDK